MSEATLLITILVELILLAFCVLEVEVILLTFRRKE